MLPLSIISYNAPPNTSHGLAGGMYEGACKM